MVKRDIEVDERGIARFPGAGVGGNLRLVELEFCGVALYALEDDTGIFDAHGDLLSAALEAQSHLEITNTDIAALEAEATIAHDRKMEADCGIALDGADDTRARALINCLRAIAETRALAASDDDEVNA